MKLPCAASRLFSPLERLDHYDCHYLIWWVALFFTVPLSIRPACCLHLVPIFSSPLVWPFWAGWPVWLLERLLTGVTTAHLSQFSLLSTRHYLLLHKNNCTAFLALHHANANTNTCTNTTANTTWPLVSISCTTTTAALGYRYSSKLLFFGPKALILGPNLFKPSFVWLFCSMLFPA